MKTSKLVVLMIVVLCVVAWFALGLHRYLQFDALRELRDVAHGYYQRSPVATLASFFAVYVFMAAASIPGAALMTLLAGAIFGLGAGTVVVSLSSTLGATLAMLIGRYLFRDFVRERFVSQAERIDRGIEQEGAFFLLALRLVPVFPFFAVNLALALTAMRGWTFAWVSMLGMFPGTVVYVNAGTELGNLQSLDGILAPEFILAFSALGIVPLVINRLVGMWRRRRVYSRFAKPARFDYDMVVIGAGAAGLVSAYIGTAVKAKVALIERERMGGDCLNTGCVPSKALLRAAKAAHEIRNAAELGVSTAPPQVDFARVMQVVHERIDQIEPHDSVARYEALGVQCISGEAYIESPWQVRVGSESLSTRNIIIAAGASPLVPAVPGLDASNVLTSENLWALDALPPRMTVMGGGPIGCEMAQAFARLGSEVTLVEMAERLVARETATAAETLQQALLADGVKLLLGARVVAVEGDAASGAVTAERGGEQHRIEHDKLLVAVGRRPNTQGYGLEELGIATGAGGVIETDEYLQTLYPNIFACGDVAGPFQFTHTAAHQAWYAAVNALFGDLKRFRADYSVIPRVTYTDPEIASVGLTPEMAETSGVAIEVTRYDLAELDRAIVDHHAHGFVQVVTANKRDRILGATIVGAGAGETLAPLVLAMRHGLGLKKILGTVHAYPTFAEANKYAAGEWSRAHVPERVLRWLAAYHRWRRG